MIILYLNFEDLLTFLSVVSSPRSCLQDIALGLFFSIQDNRVTYDKNAALQSYLSTTLLTIHIGFRDKGIIANRVFQDS